LFAPSFVVHSPTQAVDGYDLAEMFVPRMLGERRLGKEDDEQCYEKSSHGKLSIELLHSLTPALSQR
jgi:hypothetical protein